MLKTVGLEDNESTFIPKAIQPGNIVAKINKIELIENKFGVESLDVILHLETEPIEGFDGFLKNKDIPSEGKYLGQVGAIKLDQYSFSKEKKDGEKLDRDTNIMKALLRLYKALGFEQEYRTMEGKDIYDLVDQLNDNKLYQNIYMNYCIAGTEKIKDNGFSTFYCFIPKSKGKLIPFELVGTTPSNLIQFDSNIHILKKVKNPTISEFNNIAPSPFEL